MPSALKRKPLPLPFPQSDPRFRRVSDRLKSAAARTKAHPPAAKKAADAAGAAKGPPNERLAAGKGKQVDKLKEAKEGKPQESAFLVQLRAEIAKVIPKNLGQTEKFDETAQQVKGGLKQNVADQKDASTAEVSGASKQTPAPAGEAKREVPLPNEALPPAPTVPAAEGMPAPKSDADVSLQDSKQDVDQQMKEGEVTPTQMQKANDPRFSSVLTARTQVAQNADAGPARYRAMESGTLAAAAAGATGAARAGAAAMLGVRAGGNTRVLTRQQQQRARDEAKRKEVVDKIEAIYAATKARVDAKLAAIDGEVNGMFDRGVDAAINAMTRFVNKKIFDYKVDRYLSIPLVGLAAWVRDQFKGLPDEVNVFFEQGRAFFQTQMDAVLVQVADVVERRLKEAKAEVAKGQADIKAVVASQPRELQQVAQQAQSEVAGRFADLERGIDDKRDQLAQSLAQKYKEAGDRANAALKDLQDQNKGLVQAFADKLGEVLKAIAEFKARLSAALKKGEDTIKLIIADPIAFLGHLIDAVKGGFSAFANNIWTHLKAGFLKWLFGNLPPGVQPLTELTLPAILGFVLQVLGITYDRMRAKAVKLIGERNVKIIEKVVEYVRALITGGFAGLWEKVKEDLSNLKEAVIDAIQDWLITTIIKKAIEKVVSLFNPIGAIIQAILAIVSIVQFVVEKAAQILEFVESVINSINAIATGAIGAAINKVEQALARAVPLLIGFLASLLGLGGITQKIRDFITKIQDKVDKAIDKAIAKVVEFVKKLLGRGGGKADGEKMTPEKGVTEVKKHVNAAGASLAGASNITAGATMASVYATEQRWVEDNVELPGGRKPKLLLIPQENGSSFWIEVRINPTEVTTKWPRGTGGVTKEGGKTFVGLFHGSDHLVSSVDAIDLDKLGAKQRGQGLELGTGLYLSHYFHDAKNYAPRKKTHGRDGWIHKFSVPIEILEMAGSAQKPDTSGDKAWEGKGDVVKGEWKIIGDKSWKAGYQWAIKTKALILKLRLDGAYPPYKAANTWGRGERAEFPEDFGGAQESLASGRRLAAAGSSHLPPGLERSEPQTAGAG